MRERERERERERSDEFGWSQLERVGGGGGVREERERVKDKERPLTNWARHQGGRHRFRVDDNGIDEEQDILHGLPPHLMSSDLI